jgi:hypothetical protein
VINSKYSPSSKSEYGAKDLNLDVQGVKYDITANSTQDLDFLISDDYIMDGMILDAVNHVLGDKVTFQVVDIDNVLGYGANVVLKQFGTDVYMAPGLTRQVNADSVYPAKVFAGLYLRIKYTSVGETNPTLLVRYNLHKVLW